MTEPKRKTFKILLDSDDVMELTEIRTLMDYDLTKAKQKLTVFIKQQYDKMMNE